MAKDYFAEALKSTVNPDVIDAFTPLGYTPHAKQEIFHEMSRQRVGAILFGGAAALGPALQSVGYSQGYHLFNAAPYILTLLIMIATCSPKRTLIGAPAELSITR